MAGVVRELVTLLGSGDGLPSDGEQVDAIRNAIAANASEIVLSFPIGRLSARYAQQIVPGQKRILKSLEKAAIFKRNRDIYLQASRQAEQNQRRA